MTSTVSFAIWSVFLFVTVTNAFPLSNRVTVPCHLLRTIKYSVRSSRGYAPECATCHCDLVCSTGTCWKSKCILNTSESRNKCFPLRSECSACTNGTECSQGKCWGGKCTDGSDHSLRKCFLSECSPCSSLFQCSTQKCWGGKCVYDTPHSRAKCFPTVPNPIEIDPCRNRPNSETCL